MNMQSALQTPPAHTQTDSSSRVDLGDELNARAQWVADLMKADGVTAEMVTVDLALAYFDEVGRRIEAMQTIYLTRKGAREAIQSAVLASLLDRPNAHASLDVSIGPLRTHI